MPHLKSITKIAVIMKQMVTIRYSKIAILAVVVLGISCLGFNRINSNNIDFKYLNIDDLVKQDNNEKILRNVLETKISKNDSTTMPIYSHWKNFTTKDGLPGDKAYCVRIDGDRILVGTHEGLAVYDQGKWRTYTTKDGLAFNGILSIDVSELTGDVWIGTMGGLTLWSAGKFKNFTQFNSGLPNDIVYGIVCDGKDVWVATAGGAGHYNTFTKRWEIFTQQNAPMHEPWTYSVSKGEGKIFIAAWGGGVIEYTKKN